MSFRTSFLLAAAAILFAGAAPLAGRSTLAASDMTIHRGVTVADTIHRGVTVADTVLTIHRGVAVADTDLTIHRGIAIADLDMTIHRG